MNEILRRIFYHNNLLYSLRIIISIAGSTFVPWYLDQVPLIIPLTLGVVAAGLTDIDDRFMGRIYNLILIIVCFSIASLSVELLFPYPFLFIIGLLTSTIAFILLGALGRRYSVIAFGTLLIAAYTMLGHDMYSDPFIQPFYLVIGAIWYNVVSLIEAIIQPSRTTQQNLAKSFYQLSLYLNCKADMFDPDENSGFKTQLMALTEANRNLVETLNLTKNALFNRLKTMRGQITSRRMLNYYFVVQDIHERASASHGNYQELSQQLRHSDILFRFSRIISLQSKACLQLAEAINLNQPYKHNPMFSQYFIYLDEAINQYKSENKQQQFLLNALHNLYANLQAIDLLLVNINTSEQLSAQQAQNQIVDDHISSLSDIWRRVKRQLTIKSPLFRHAVRLSLVFCVGYLIIQVTHLEHGYWIMLTSLFVCQPNYSTTQRRLKLRVLGTIVGILLGLPLTYLLPNIQAQLVLIILSGWLFFLFKNSQYAYATAFITLLVFFSFGLVGESSVSVATYRIIATLIGCFIAWIGVSFLWPDWKFRNLSQLVLRLCHNDYHYLVLIGKQYQTGKIDDVEYRLARRQAHDTEGELSSLLGIMASEPHVIKQQIDSGFRLLTLNHNLIGYISTLGAHRDKPLSGKALKLFDETAVYLVTTLNHYNQETQQDEYQAVKQTLLDYLEQLNPLEERDKNDILVMQQLLLILDLLPEMMMIILQLINRKAA